MRNTIGKGFTIKPCLRRTGLESKSDRGNGVRHAKEAT